MRTRQIIFFSGCIIILSFAVGMGLFYDRLSFGNAAYYASSQDVLPALQTTCDAPPDGIFRITREQCLPLDEPSGKRLGFFADQVTPGNTFTFHTTEKAGRVVFACLTDEATQTTFWVRVGCGARE